MRRLNIPWGLSAAVIALTVVACATSPTGRRQLVLLPESQIVVMGVQSFHQLQDNTPIEKKPAVKAYVQCVADAITRLPPVQEQSTDWEVVVFDSKDVNAFALPGGKIGVYNGLLTAAQTQDQLAAVIGHEVGHVLARHGNERMSQQFAAQQGLALLDTWMTANNSGSRQTAMALLGIGAQVGVLLPFSRIQESEADKIGLHLMAMAGFDPRESVKLWQNMSKSGGGNPPEFMSTHPSHGTRIHDLEAGMASAVTRYEEARAAGRRPACKAPA